MKASVCAYRRMLCLTKTYPASNSVSACIVKPLHIIPVPTLGDLEEFTNLHHAIEAEPTTHAERQWGGGCPRNILVTVLKHPTGLAIHLPGAMEGTYEEGCNQIINPM